MTRKKTSKKPARTIDREAMRKAVDAIIPDFIRLSEKVSGLHDEACHACDAFFQAVGTRDYKHPNVNVTRAVVASRNLLNDAWEDMLSLIRWLVTDAALDMTPTRANSPEDSYVQEKASEFHRMLEERGLIARKPRRKAVRS